MEKKLKSLFDFQRFDPSPRLSKMIEKAESRGVRELTDEEAELVSAAGGCDFGPGKDAKKLQ